MSIVYNGAHSIYFRKYTNVYKTEYTDANTWTYFHMVPATRPYVVSPEPRISFVNIPRSNKILDLTNSLTSDVTYEASEGDWEFYIDHDKWNDWSEAYDEISEYFDGSWFDVWLGDQLDYKYSGRVYANTYRPEANYSRINLHYSFDVNLYNTEDPYDGYVEPEWVVDYEGYVAFYNIVTIGGHQYIMSGGHMETGSTVSETLRRITVSADWLNNTTLYVSNEQLNKVYAISGSETDPHSIYSIFTTHETFNKVYIGFDYSLIHSPDKVYCKLEYAKNGSAPPSPDPDPDPQPSDYFVTDISSKYIYEHESIQVDNGSGSTMTLGLSDAISLNYDSNIVNYKLTLTSRGSNAYATPTRIYLVKKTSSGSSSYEYTLLQGKKQDGDYHPYAFVFPSRFFAEAPRDIYLAGGGSIGSLDRDKAIYAKIEHLHSGSEIII